MWLLFEFYLSTDIDNINMELKEQIQNLNAQLNQQHEQSQYHKHENEQDFGMYL